MSTLIYLFFCLYYCA